MITTNEDLKNAFHQICEKYEKENKSIGKLKKIGFRNKWNYVITEDNLFGMAFNFSADHAVYGQVDNMEQFIKLKPFIGKNIADFVEYLLSEYDIQMRSICLAVLNALSGPLIEGNSDTVAFNESYDFIKPEDVVTIIGYGGVVGKIYGKCKELHISDMRPSYLLNTLTIGEDIVYGPEKITFHSETENEKVLAKSDIVIMSGCTLVNGTFKEIIDYSKKARVIGMYGPSAGIIPEFLFENGINYISSSRIKGNTELEYQFANSLDMSYSTKSCMIPYAISNL